MFWKTLTINSESPIMYQWHIKERNHSLFWSYITKSESRSEFSFLLSQCPLLFMSVYSQSPCLLEYFTGMFNRVYKGLSHWLQLSPTGTENKYHCLSNNVYMLSPFVVDIPFVRLLFAFSVFNKLLSEHTCKHICPTWVCYL